MKKHMFLIGKLFLSSKISLDNGQFKCAVKRKINSLSAIFLHAFPRTPFLQTTYFQSDVNRKAREPRVSICQERLRVTCIDQTTRTFSSVRSIELYRSANPKYDSDTFLSILNYD